MIIKHFVGVHRKCPLLAVLFFVGVSLISSQANPNVIEIGSGQFGPSPAPGDFHISFKSELAFANTLLNLRLANHTNPEEGDEQIGVTQTNIQQLPQHVVEYALPPGYKNETIARTRPGSDSITSQSWITAFSYADDGTMPGSMRVSAVFHNSAGVAKSVELDNIETSPFPDAGSQSTRVIKWLRDAGGALQYTRADPVTGALNCEIVSIDADGQVVEPPLVVAEGLSNVDMCGIDQGGRNLALVGEKNRQIVCHIVDLDARTVGPEIRVSDDPDAFLNFTPCVDGDRETGDFVVAWVSAQMGDGDPGDIRFRKINSGGVPLGEDLLVNTDTAGAQNQPCVSCGPDGLSAIAWVDGSFGGPDWHDIKLQVFAGCDPFGDQISVNSVTEHDQQQPEVSFVQDPASGLLPQCVVRYSSIETDQFGPTGKAIGTGREYRWYEIDCLVLDTDGDGLSDADEIAMGTDPEKADTDGDGRSDGAEFLDLTDPLDPKDVLRIKSVTIEERNGQDCVRVTIPTKEGIAYSLWRCDPANMALKTVVPGQENVAGTGEDLDFIAVIVAGQEGDFFLRVLPSGIE